MWLFQSDKNLPWPQIISVLLGRAALLLLATHGCEKSGQCFLLFLLSFYKPDTLLCLALSLLPFPSYSVRVCCTQRTLQTYFNNVVSYFYVDVYPEITLHLQVGCADGTKHSCVHLTQLPVLLATCITTVYLSRVLQILTMDVKHSLFLNSLFTADSQQDQSVFHSNLII